MTKVIKIPQRRVKCRSWDDALREEISSRRRKNQPIEYNRFRTTSICSRMISEYNVPLSCAIALDLIFVMS